MYSAQQLQRITDVSKIAASAMRWGLNCNVIPASELLLIHNIARNGIGWQEIADLVLYGELVGNARMAKTFI